MVRVQVGYLFPALQERSDGMPLYMNVAPVLPLRECSDLAC